MPLSELAQEIRHLDAVALNRKICHFRDLDNGGEGEIRTPDTVARMPHFECGAFNHSATSPGCEGV
jgi:hypothetical protein